LPDLFYVVLHQLGWRRGQRQVHFFELEVVGYVVHVEVGGHVAAQAVGFEDIAELIGFVEGHGGRGGKRKSVWGLPAGPAHNSQTLSVFRNLKTTRQQLR
jgi:hypothetical protein